MRTKLAGPGCVLLLWLVPAVAGQDIDPPQTGPPAATEYDTPRGAKERFLDWLPKPISEGLELDFWVWLGYLHNDQPTESDIFDAELSLSIVKSFKQRVALGLQVNWISANSEDRFELRQSYVSARLTEEGESIATIGKFNANIGVEGRDFWTRRTGTTSLLFGAQPQDLVGGMFTLPLGESGLKLRPFISADFQGDFYFDQPPSGGATLEYAPCSEATFKVTNWVGPGIVLFGGEPLHEPFPKGSYGADTGYVIANWQGPNLTAERDGTLYFLDVSAVYRPTPRVALSAEYLMGTTGTNGYRSGWEGWLAMVDVDITDKLHAYGRFSYLDDRDWLITGLFQQHRELSVGAGYRLLERLEFRAEYRHDYSNIEPTDIDMISFHVTWGF